jgi:beta-lactamase superfamily II metal-dependent hydrolase
MYRQGLGDCFLLTVTDHDADHHVLIDFGVLLGTPDATAVMRSVATNIAEVTGGRLDAVVATHEHWDHISGFRQAQDILDGLQIDMAWLAWTERPNDRLADELRTRRDTAMRQIAAAAQACAAVDARRSDRLTGLLGFYGDIAARGSSTTRGSTTASALQWLKEKAATTCYLEPGGRFEAFGLGVHVLGPPRDEKMIKKSDPSRTHPEVYTLDTGSDLLASGPPFDRFFGLDAEFIREYPMVTAGYLAPADRWRRIDADWAGAAESLALRLDSDTNNTSLVLALELGGGGPVLLFTGDAQVGSWLSWEKLEWSTAVGPVHSADLLARTVLYKVGHHGSHNATLREKGLELMTSPDLVAMIPVDRVMAKRQRWNMPLPALLRRLEEKTRGRILDAQLGRPEIKPEALSQTDWEQFVARTDVAPRWVDYRLDW